MLTALSRHSGIDIDLTCTGDLDVDGHHTSEDCALVLGQAIDKALGDRRGITRFGYAYAPLDEALARCVIDLSGRPWPEVNLDFRRSESERWPPKTLPMSLNPWPSACEPISTST